MADAGIDLSIRTDSSQAASGVREVEEAIRRAARTSDESSRRSTDAAQRNLQLYREETRILDLRARGRNDIADALRAEVDMRRMGMRLERELRVTEEQGLALARQRLAVERDIADQASRAATAARAAPPPIVRPQLSGTRIDPSRSRSLEEYRRLMSSGSGGPSNSKGGDLNSAYFIGQDLIQGGVGAIANQAPQLIDLARRYGKTTAVVGAGATTYGAYEAWKWMQNAVDDSDDSVIGRRRRQSALTNQAKAWNAERAKLQKDGTAAGLEQSGVHGRIVRDYEAAADLRGTQNEIAASAAEAAFRNRRSAAEAGEMDPLARIRKLADLDKEYLADRDRAARTAMDEELRQASMEANLAQRRKTEIAELMAAEEKRIALGRMATNEEIRAIAAAKAEAAGLDDRMKAAQSRLVELEQRSRALHMEIRTMRPIENAGIDAQAARDQEDVKTEAAKKVVENFVTSGKAFGKALWDIAQDIPKVGKARADREKEMEILELRSRGQNRRADRLQRTADIEERADALEKGPEKMDRQKALKEAEREYDLRNPSRRIRGAGFGDRGAGSRRSATEFTGLDGLRGGGIDGTGGLDWLSRLNSRNRRVGEADGIDALHQQNRKIRGAGFKADQQTKDIAAPAAQQQAAGGGAGPLTAILGAISGLRSDVRALVSASRTIRR